MAVDLSVFDRLKSKSDFDREAEKYALEKLSKQAEIKKASMLDVDKLGEVAFMKAAMGQPLTPQETAAAQFIDAKSGGIVYNPVTGEATQKPRLTDRIGLPGGVSGASMPPVGANYQNANQFGIQPLDESALFDGSAGAVDAPMPSPGLGKAMPPVESLTVPVYRNPIIDELDAQIATAANPKIKQELLAAKAKAVTTMNDEQSKAAGFADRLFSVNPIISQNEQALIDPVQVTKGNVPLVGNFLTSPEYKSGTQAQRDFINAVLRRESGAVISPEEFENARQQYFPQPGDDEFARQQKAKARQIAAETMMRSAGPAYKPPEQLPEIPKPALYKKGEVEFNLRKRGYTPDQIKEYKRLRGID